MNISFNGFSPFGGYGGINTNSNQYKAAMKMLNQAWAVSPQSRPTSDWQMQLVIKNYMKKFDADGDYIDPVTGMAGYDTSCEGS